MSSIYKRRFRRLFERPSCFVDEDVRLFDFLKVPKRFFFALCLILRKSHQLWMCKQLPENKYWVKRLAKSLFELDMWMHEIYNSPTLEGSQAWKLYLKTQLENRIQHSANMYEQWYIQTA